MAGGAAASIALYDADHERQPALRARDGHGALTLYLVIEHFADGDPVPVYQRFRERGRLAPPGLDYRGSWVTTDLTRCYQVMECEDRTLLDEWMAQWDDLVRFEVAEVLTSDEASQAVGLPE
jgi:hypothetical protein